MHKTLYRNSGEDIVHCWLLFVSSADLQACCEAAGQEALSPEIPDSGGNSSKNPSRAKVPGSLPESPASEGSLSPLSPFVLPWTMAGTGFETCARAGADAAAVQAGPRSPVRSLEGWSLPVVSSPDRQTGDRPRPPPGQLSATGCAGGRPGERKTQLADECGPRMGQKTYAVGAVTRPWSEGLASGSRPGRFWPGGPGSGRPSPRHCPRPHSIWTDRGDRYTRAPCAWD